MNSSKTNRFSSSANSSQRLNVVLSLLLAVGGSFLSFEHILAPRAEAQVEPPDRRFLFLEDRNKKERERLKKVATNQRRAQARAQQKQSKDLPFDINATDLNFDQNSNKVIAEGNVAISHAGTSVTAEKGTFDLQNHIAELSGDVRINDITGNLIADNATLNLDAGTGKLTNSKVFFEDGEYIVESSEAEKIEGDDFIFEDASLTTCDCPKGDDSCPWKLEAREGKIVNDGYGTVKDAKLRVHGVPVFYFPYLIFPAKTERQTGFLPVAFGTGKESGFKLQIPFFWAINQSTDMTIAPLIETETRVGSDFELRKIFSAHNQFESGLTYLNESMRDGDLQGTNTDGLSDPSIDTNRFMGYLDHVWQGEAFGKRSQFIAVGNYVSDDLLLREFENDKIADFNSRFVTSTALFRTELFDTYGAEISSEFNQAMVSDDDFVFQRLPELGLAGFDVFHPFGENPLGAKLVVGSEFTGTEFYRSRSYDGGRADLYEKAQVPFHIRNYLAGSIQADARATYYSLNNTEQLTTNPDVSGPKTDDGYTIQELDKTSNRVVPGFTLRANTVVEKVFEVGEGSLLKKIIELGPVARREELKRLKHTLEPGVKYRFVPTVDQDSNPQFDSIDKLARRNIITYGLTQRLFSRFEPRDEYVYGIEEATPELEDLGSLSSPGVVDDDLTFGFGEPGGGLFRSLRAGSKSELANLRLYQSYDLDIARQSIDERNDSPDNSNQFGNYDAFSDLGMDLVLYPNDHFRLHSGANLDAEQASFSSYNIEGQFIDKRGDEIRTRLNFIEDNVRQLETGLQVQMTENMKLGYYSRYDDLTAEFIENRFGVRLTSSCKCWIFDLDVSDRINPDETKMAFNITLVGLGEFSNSFFSFNDRQDSGY